MSESSGRKQYGKAKRQKVPPFARYKGTSAWRKDKRRVKAYALFRAQQKRADAQGTAVGA